MTENIDSTNEGNSVASVADVDASECGGGVVNTADAVSSPSSSKGSRSHGHKDKKKTHKKKQHHSHHQRNQSSSSLSPPPSPQTDKALSSTSISSDASAAPLAEEEAKGSGKEVTPTMEEDGDASSIQSSAQAVDGEATQATSAAQELTLSPKEKRRSEKKEKKRLKEKETEGDATNDKEISVDEKEKDKDKRSKKKKERKTSLLRTDSSMSKTTTSSTVGDVTSTTKVEEAGQDNARDSKPTRTSSTASLSSTAASDKEDHSKQDATSDNVVTEAEEEEEGEKQLTPTEQQKKKQSKSDKKQHDNRSEKKERKEKTKEKVSSSSSSQLVESDSKSHKSEKRRQKEKHESSVADVAASSPDAPATDDKETSSSIPVASGSMVVVTKSEETDADDHVTGDRKSKQSKATRKSTISSEGESSVASPVSPSVSHRKDKPHKHKERQKRSSSKRRGSDSESSNDEPVIQAYLHKGRRSSNPENVAHGSSSRDAIFVSSLASIPEEEEEEEEVGEEKTVTGQISVTTALSDSSPRKQSSAVLYPSLKPIDEKKKAKNRRNSAGEIKTGAFTTFWTNLVSKLGTRATPNEDKKINDTLSREGDLISPCDGWIRDEFLEASTQIPLTSPSKSDDSPNISSPSAKTESPSPKLSDNILIGSNPVDELDFYEKNFCDKEHQNFICFVEEIGVVILSISINKEEQSGAIDIRKLEEEPFSDSDEKCFSDSEKESNKDKKDRPKKSKYVKLIVRAVLRTRKEDKKVLFIEYESKLKGENKVIEIVLKKMQLSSVLHPKQFKRIESNLSDLQKDLVEFEALQADVIRAVKTHKVGLVNQKDEQATEEDILGNTEISPAFEEFIDFIGKRIELNGWTGYSAGLDVERSETGTQSLYSEWVDHKFMFHVAPFLPYSKTNSQQIERKRHIGNDVVVVVFQESDKKPYCPKTISSHVNHVIVVIRPIKDNDKTKYKMAVSVKQGMQPFSPILGPSLDTIYEKNDVFKDLFFSKIVGAEQEAVYAPEFINRLERSRNAALKAVALKHNIPISGGLWQQ
eukprot:TRINITY_DN283_c0_g4_i2.p1 TRINITY_DN283_c0_g4~~TRINITY_DN283_c0_g4_i2.p1  ORF type:complete len:1041 (+),score=351.25 TRINITY_DN283_c0_g4_i2:113-3235(+)